jgi:hypothetical protein
MTVSRPGIGRADMLLLHQLPGGQRDDTARVSMARPCVLKTRSRPCVCADDGIASRRRTRRRAPTASTAAWRLMQNHAGDNVDTDQQVVNRQLSLYRRRTRRHAPTALSAAHVLMTGCVCRWHVRVC